MPEFKIYQSQVMANAKKMAAVIMARGFKVVSGGTDNHLFLIDLVDKNITGKDAEAALDTANMTVNKNAVPNDPHSPFVTGGLRIGTPAMTTRGMGLEEAGKIAELICDILLDMQNGSLPLAAKQKVLQLCRQFPVYSS